MSKYDHLVEMLAFSAARVLTYGLETPDWKEWRTLKDDLLTLLPHIKSKEISRYVGYACSEFNERLRDVLKSK